MKTLPNSQATFFDGTELPLMSSQADSRAKILAALENKLALKKAPAADCGPKSSDLLASYHPATSSWRTSQRCLVAQVNNVGDGLAEYSETWPSAGMMRSGKTYQQQPWALPTVAKGSGLLPTPRSCSAMAAENIGNRVNDKFPNLESVVARSLWPTPTKSDWKGPNLSGGKSASCHGLATMAHKSMWPTPAASDNRDRGNLSSPSVKRRIRIGKQVSLGQSVSHESGALNPPWVEWLMGFPTGWTDLKD
jgi:hypothetical protein